MKWWSNRKINWKINWKTQLNWNKCKIWLKKTKYHWDRNVGIRMVIMIRIYNVRVKESVEHIVVEGMKI